MFGAMAGMLGNSAGLRPMGGAAGDLGMTGQNGGAGGMSDEEMQRRRRMMLQFGMARPGAMGAAAQALFGGAPSA